MHEKYRINGGVIDRAMAGIMVSIFSKMSRIDKLVKLLQDMKTEETPLDGRLYRSALNSLREAGLQVQAKWLQQSAELWNDIATTLCILFELPSVKIHTYRKGADRKLYEGVCIIV